MDATIDTLRQLLSNISQEVYIVTGIAIASLLFFIHLYSLRQEKKKGINTISTNVNIFEKAFNAASDGMLIFNESYKVIYSNKSITTLFGLRKGFQDGTFELMPKIKMGKEWVTLSLFIDKQINRLKGDALLFPQSLLQIKQKEVLVNLYLDVIPNENKNSKKHFIVTMQDLADIKKYRQRQYEHILTGLPNQRQALEDMPSLFSKIHTENNKIALALMSFDNFSVLRSIIGYEQANEVIVKFSKTLFDITSDKKIKIYHTFDNHFLLTMVNIESVEEIKLVIRDLQKRLAKAYKIENANMHLTVSSGVAIYPESGPTRTLLDNTYKALAEAQKVGDGNVIVYFPTTIENKFDELKLHNDMKIGLERGEFEVYYQPIVDAKTEEIFAAEALIRWIHPKLGFIPPDVFIGLMEKTGFIIKLGQYVLEEVLKQQKRWELFKFKPIEVSINVSMVEIATGEFVQHVKAQLKHHQISPERIKFEITEGMAMMGEEKTEEYFYQLKALGVGISLDDFGTGYTSFTYLKRFPADILKIDKSLVDNILTHDEDRQIVCAIIELGHNLGMKIVVEGVEIKEMLQVLVKAKADYIQGYYFSKPLPVFEFQKLLR